MNNNNFNQQIMDKQAAQEPYNIQRNVISEITKTVKKQPPAAENNPENISPHKAAPLGDGISNGWMRESGGD